MRGRRSQPRLKGGRDPLPSCVDPRIRAWAKREAAKWKCSVSWIVAVALGEASGIDVVAPYEEKKNGERRMRVDDHQMASTT